MFGRDAPRLVVGFRQCIAHPAGLSRKANVILVAPFVLPVACELIRSLLSKISLQRLRASKRRYPHALNRGSSQQHRTRTPRLLQDRVRQEPFLLFACSALALSPLCHPKPRRPVVSRESARGCDRQRAVGV